MKQYQILITLIALFFSQMPFAVHAGPYSERLSQCLTESINQRDKSILMKWMIAAMVQHPEARSVFQISKNKFEKISKDAANVFVKLTSQSCKQETLNTMKYEGELGIKYGFGKLGVIISKEILNNPEVVHAISNLEKYIDKNKMQTVMESQ